MNTLTVQNKNWGPKSSNQEAGLTVFLSVPAPLFEEGLLNPELENYFELAQAVGAIQLKVNLGAYNQETVATDMTLVNNLIDCFGISLTLENDNTQATGASDYFKAFLQDNGNDKVGMCFDVGNFLYYDEDPVAAVKKVLPLVHYVHLKQVEQATNTSLAGLSVGDVDVGAILKEIDPAIPVAIECQYKASILRKLKDKSKTISKISIWLKLENSQKCLWTNL